MTRITISFAAALCLVLSRNANFVIAGRTTDATASRSITPTQTQLPLPILRTVPDADTTTPTTESQIKASEAMEAGCAAIIRADDGNRSVWSRLQRRARVPSFDIVPLPHNHRSSVNSNSRKHKPTSPTPAARLKRQRPSSGTRFDLRPPSQERLSRWFGSVAGVGGGDLAIQKRKHKTATSLFNHDSVGMTNPVLHISSDQDPNNVYPGVYYDQLSPTASVSLASTTPTTSNTRQEQFELQDSWIPASTIIAPSPQSTSTLSSNGIGAHVLQYKRKSAPSERNGAEKAWFPLTQEQQANRSISKKRKKWRQCRYRRRVGQGQACYERVREVALAWQFNRTEHPVQGILPVRSPQQRQPDSDSNSMTGSRHGSKNDYFQLDDHASQNVQPLWSGPHTEGSRRLVTFTTSGFKFSWLPKLYTINPVMVVYDLLDQRGPGTTYSSTAYATMKGHLLRGEERVTVAMRDDTGFVDVEILSYSRAGGSLKAKVIWPLIGKMQQQFFQNQIDFLEQIAVP